MLIPYRAASFEIDNNFVSFECRDCRYIAIPGFNLDGPRDDQEREETVADFDFHNCDETFHNQNEWN